VFASLLLALMPGQYVDNKDFPREKQEAALAATAGIVHQATNGEGTAVIVNYDQAKGVVYLLTAAHVVPPGEGGDWVNLEFFTPKKFPNVDLKAGGFVIARMANEDIAVVRAAVPSGTKLGSLKICPKAELPTPERKNVTVLTAGCEGDKRLPRLTTELVLGKEIPSKPNGAQVLCWETDHPPVQGRSGGPLIDKRGYVMGICSGAEKQRGYYTYILKIHQALSGAGLGWLVEGELKTPAK